MSTGMTLDIRQIGSEAATFPGHRERLRLADALLCDERSIRKALRGLPLRGVTGERIRGDLRALGYSVPEPTK